MMGQTNCPLLWPQSPVMERLSWLTDRMQVRSGASQNIQCRAYPRRYFQVTYFPHNDAHAQRLDNQVMALRAASWWFPIYPEYMQATAIPGVGAGSVSVSTTYMTLAAADKVLLWQDADTNELLEAASVASGSVTFVDPVSETFTGPVFVVPVHAARLADVPKKERRPGLPDKFTLTFMIEEQRNLPTTTGLDTYLPPGLTSDFTYNVLSAPSLLPDNEVTPVQFTTYISEFDYETGKTYFDGPDNVVGQHVELSFLKNTLADAFALRAFFAHSRGGGQPFYMPIFDSSFILAENIVNSTTMKIVDCNHRSVWGLDTRKHVYLEYQTNPSTITRYYRQINNVEAGSAGQEDFTLVSKFSTGTFEPSKVLTLCWLGKFCLEEDDIEMEWGLSPLLRVKTIAKEVL